MRATFGQEASAKKRGIVQLVSYDSKRLANGHALILGMSGSGKTHLIRSLLKQMEESIDPTVKIPLRVHIFDPHGDIDIPGASTVMFSEQTNYGMNPLRVNPDPHFGGLRKRVQSFISNMNRVMHQLGPKQEACLRNILYDVYAQHGFSQTDANTWHVAEGATTLLSTGANNRFYIDVPKGEKDQAKALGARWDGEKYCWFVEPADYVGGITRWPPKMTGRSHPSIKDALVYARRVLQMSFMGSDQEAITHLEIFHRATTQYQKKVLESMRRGVANADDERDQAELDKKATKAVETFKNYVDACKTGRELTDLMKYDSTEVLKSVVDRLENLDSIGVFKPTPPPFDESATSWRYHIKALNIDERKLFVLCKLEEIFSRAIERGEQSDVIEIVVLDEAHIYVDDDPSSILNNISTESRKFGLAMICASQEPTHFPASFISSVATKVILGIDESHWKQTVSKWNVPLEALNWIRLQNSMLVQLKEKGSAKNEWRWTLIDKDVPQENRQIGSLQECA